LRLPRYTSRASLDANRMQTAAPLAEEFIGYRRSPALLGLEVLDAYHTARDWRCVGLGYAVTVPRTWRGEVLYRGFVHAVEPGIAFCNQPDEAMLGKPEAGQPGSFNVLVIQPELLAEWISEQQVRPVRAQFSAITKPVSSGLVANFWRLFAALEQGGSDMELQSKAVDVSESLITELIAGANDAKLREGPAIRGTARMRECLHEEGLDIDLDTLARRAGLNRFQAVRAFKRRYGLPPHAYQLGLRITRARHLLLAGAPPADVAAQCGFLDQSHFCRHFKRILGVTPMRYVQADVASRRRSSGTHRTSPAQSQDFSAAQSRSDWRRDP
jgi:AraC-like DNA-binding protein